VVNFNELLPRTDSGAVMRPDSFVYFGDT